MKYYLTHSITGEQIPFTPTSVFNIPEEAERTAPKRKGEWRVISVQLDYAVIHRFTHT